MIGHDGAQLRQTRTHGGLVEAFAEVDDGIARAGVNRIDDMRRGAVEEEQPQVRHGDGVEAVRIAGAEIERRGLAVRAERGVHAAHERRFADARPALEHDHPAEIALGEQVVKAGNEAIRAHRAGKQGTH